MVTVTLDRRANNLLEFGIKQPKGIGVLVHQGQHGCGEQVGDGRVTAFQAVACGVAALADKGMVGLPEQFCDLAVGIGGELDGDERGGVTYVCQTTGKATGLEDILGPLTGTDNSKRDMI